MELIFSSQKPEELVEVLSSECVVDMSSGGQIIGFELINASIWADVSSIDTVTAVASEPLPVLRWSYDPDADVLYVKMANERSSFQEVRLCNIVRSTAGRLIRVDVVESGVKSTYSRLVI
jgi:uncharacterized protein YuzE